MGVTASSSARSPMVKTLSGPICGREYILSDGRIVDMYMGIPYAEPPIGKLRFKVRISFTTSDIREGIAH
ncbi:hypothetical protein KIN20_002724 [Parelaphostrongylus tenuis]|uniref:Carboxylesterase type B domain-containing protein n=1 Tax=Parelaphostrongylus tenuis TaxID=148309 RepID=A0AAD5QI18_PARTN|nr:hypothetical protein KIN20_002724 [Parelaphostrongylus tenuis]